MATTYDKASLVMIPSGVKESKVYSIKPTDGSGDFTFSRGTDTATRVNSSGLIEKERGNLILQSNTFSTTWGNLRSTETSGQSGYDGTSDAWLLESTATATSAYLKENISNSGVYTMSVYAKAGTSDWLSLNTAGSQFAYFDLANGILGSKSSNVVDSSIESIGNGWYRCSATLVDNNDFYVFIANGDGNLTTNSGDNIYIQDAQVNQGLVAQPYIETTTSAVYEGITDNLPRLDYSGGASCPSLLLEPSRTNLFPHSEYFGASDWVKLGAGTGDAPIVTENYAISPEGVQNATRIQLNLNGGTGSGSNQSLFYDDLGSKTGDYTRSVYIKSLTTDTDLYFGGTFSDFKLITATTEWQRFDFTSTLSAATLYATIGLRGATGSSDSADILVYGFQAEAGSYPTSYIPTYGTSASRAADDAVVNYTEISDTGGTLFYQGFTDIGTDSHLIALSNSSGASGNNRVLFYRSSSDNKVWLYVQSGGASVQNISLELPTDANDKYAVAWATNDFAVYINGVQEYTSSTGAIPTGMQYLQLNEWNSAHEETNIVKQVLYFPTRLTNAELAALTA